MKHALPPTRVARRSLRPRTMKHAKEPARRTSTRARLVVAGGLAAVGIAGVGGAAFAAFNATSSASQTVDSGTITLNNIGTNATGNRLSVNATGLGSGDTIQRAVTLTNGGTLDLSSIVLTTTASPSSLLDTDTVTGLQMTIDRCSVAWAESAFPYTYTCGGTTTSVVASRPVIGTNIAMSGLTLTPGATNNLRVTLTLPAAAPNTLQGKSSTINYSFTANQRAATNK